MGVFFCLKYHLPRQSSSFHTIPPVTRIIGVHFTTHPPSTGSLCSSKVFSYTPPFGQDDNCLPTKYATQLRATEKNNRAWAEYRGRRILTRQSRRGRVFTASGQDEFEKDGTKEKALINHFLLTPDEAIHLYKEEEILDANYRRHPTKKTCTEPALSRGVSGKGSSGHCYSGYKPTSRLRCSHFIIFPNIWSIGPMQRSREFGKMYPQDLGTQGGELRAQHGHIQLQQMPLMVPPVSNTFNPMTNGSVPQETKRPCWPAHPAATTWTELPPKPALPHTTSRWTPALSPFRGDHTQSSQALPSQGRYNLRSMSQRSFATTPGNNDGRVDDGAEAATVHHRTAYSGKEQLSSPAFDFEMAIPRHTLALPKEKVKSPPSKKSGGVPEPTKSYLEAASAQPARMIPRSKALLVIFDLNGTLLHRKVGSAKYTERPYTQTFINYCIDKFTVMVWSSATRSNVDAMCDKLFADHPGIPRWTRDDFGLTKDDMKRNVQVYKRLTRVWSTESIQDKHPYRARGAKWNQSNTVLIDDSKEKARSEPFNCITLPTFDGYPEGGASVLPLVHDYLNVLACQEDVSRYIKQHPFNVNKEPPKIPSTALMSDGEYAKVDIDACIEAIGEVCAEGAAMARRGRSDIIQAS